VGRGEKGRGGEERECGRELENEEGRRKELTELMGIDGRNRREGQGKVGEYLPSLTDPLDPPLPNRAFGLGLV